MTKIIKTFDVSLDTLVNVPICDNWEKLAKERFIQILQNDQVVFNPEVYEEDSSYMDQSRRVEKVIETPEKIEEIIKREGGE